MSRKEIFLFGSSNSVFAMIECACLFVAMYIGRHVGAGQVLLSTLLGVVLILVAITVPLISFVISHGENLYFGAFHLKMLFAVLFGIVACVTFFACHVFQLPSALAIVLLVLSFVVLQVSVVVFRVCAYSISSAVIYRDRDERFVERVKQIFLVFGVLVAIVLCELYAHNEMANIGYIMSTVVLLVGLAAFFSTFCYLPIIKLSQARTKLSKRERIGQIYSDFVATFSLTEHKRRLAAFILSAIYFGLLLCGTQFFLVNVLEFEPLVTAAVLCLMVAFFVFGILLSARATANAPDSVVTTLNSIAVSICIFLICAVFVLGVVGVIKPNLVLAGGLVIVVGGCMGVTYHALNKLYIDKLNVKRPFSIKTVVYMLSLGMATIIMGIFGWLYDGAVLPTIMTIALFVATLTLCALVSAIMFVLSSETQKTNDKEESA